jgi:hypothetical protein
MLSDMQLKQEKLEESAQPSLNSSLVQIMPVDQSDLQTSLSNQTIPNYRQMFQPSLDHVRQIQQPPSFHLSCFCLMQLTLNNQECEPFSLLVVDNNFFSLGSEVCMYSTIFMHLMTVI